MAIGYAGSFLILHFIIAGIISALCLAGVLKTPKAILPLVILIPGIGELIVLCLHIHTVRGLDARDFDRIDRGRDSQPFHDSGFFQQDTRDTSVPVEDALIIHKGRERQVILRNAVLHNAGGNLSLLREASRSSDPEIVHFATTALAQEDNRNEKLFSGFEKRLGQAKARSQKTGSTAEYLTVLDQYIETLKKYLAKADRSETIREVREKRLAALLKERISIHSSPEHMILLAEASQDLHDDKTALEVLDQMDFEWPNDPDAWIQRFRYHYTHRDKRAMDRMIREYRSDPLLVSRRIDDIIAIWGS